MNEQIKYWFDMAEYDIETASAMLETKRFLYVGFMCHQCIEKSLKALILSTSDEPSIPKIHNLLRLAERCGILDKMNDKQKEILFLLNPLNIESRYPTYKDSLLSQLTSERCETIIKDTRELLEWIKTEL